jgi:hypothetical protein
MSSMQFITKGVPKLAQPSNMSVCLPFSFKRCFLSITRDGDTKMWPISKGVAAELISSGIPYQG